jgi:peptidoglycan hydrolase-like protein with peptidoglycan-binding domain
MMSNSKLVLYKRVSPNRTSPRNHSIDRITIHHTAGVLGLTTLGRIFANPLRRASSNYGINKYGLVGMFVEEKDRAWTSSSRENDHRAITIEVSNSEVGGDWPVSVKAYNALIRLCVDICKRNGIKKLTYTGDSRGNLTEHWMFAATLCPGPYLHKRMRKIAAEVNAILSLAPYMGAYPKATVSRTTGTMADIKLWQKYLCWYGPIVVVDGSFGPDTQEKTIAFQHKNGLKSDGIVGPQTIAKAKTIRR